MPRGRFRHWQTGQCVLWDDTSKRWVAAESSTPSTPAILAELTWVAPAFFDIQINGGLGHSFNSPTVTLADFQAIDLQCQLAGIGWYFPTLITTSPDEFEQAFRSLTRHLAEDSHLKKRCPGFHLEGPYLSEIDGPRGAHPKQWICDPDWDQFQRWQEAAEGQIRLITLAPERPGSIVFIEKAVQTGVVVAIGHTHATTEILQDATSAGAKLSTHLGNGCASQLPRHPNLLWDQLADTRLMASLIADGHHLPKAVLQCMIAAKKTKSVILTCDASPLAGLPPGVYQQWGTELEVCANGAVRLKGTPLLGGSGVYLDHCVRYLLMEKIVTLAEAIEMASLSARRLFVLPPESYGNSFIEFEWSETTPFRVLRSWNDDENATENFGVGSELNAD